MVGVDCQPFATTRWVCDITDTARLRDAMGETEAVVHTASLHAPHVGVRSDREFERVNLHALETLLELALARGVVCFVYTSTTALYGDAVVDSACRWIDEQVEPIPRTIFHRTKLAAEAMVAGATSSTLRTRVLRMSRCFPEAADQMAVYRQHRGVDVRDVADAHALALADGRSGHQWRWSVATHRFGVQTRVHWRIRQQRSSAALHRLWRVRSDSGPGRCRRRSIASTMPLTLGVCGAGVRATVTG